MISLQPRETFQIVRQLGDHTDPTTYYVRAVVRNSVDDTILKTQNLTVNATDIRRFKANYEVPADVSGLGFYIDITTSVYTDDTYTTKSSTYYDENNSYLIFDRIVRPGGSGGGSDVDYKKIQKMLDTLRKSMEDPKDFNIEPIMAAIMGLGKKVDGIDIPSAEDFAEKVELKPILVAIDGAKETILNAFDKKEPHEATEIQPILDAIGEVDDKIDRTAVTILEKIDKSKEDIMECMEKEDQKEEELPVPMPSEEEIRKESLKKRVTKITKGGGILPERIKSLL